MNTGRYPQDRVDRGQRGAAEGLRDSLSKGEYLPEKPTALGEARAALERRRSGEIS